MRKQILFLGDSALYEKSIAVQKEEDLTQLVQDLHDTLMDYRKKHHAGRAIAAPQIGVKKGSSIFIYKSLLCLSILFLHLMEKKKCRC